MEITYPVSTVNFSSVDT